jgi:putative ABC transport system substrate-binding protein
VKRRSFITLLGGAAVIWPLAARAQHSERVRRIGVLMAYPESDPEGHALVAAFRQGLRKLGWTEGHSIQIETRWATPDVALMQRFARELIALQPSLILTQNTPPLRRCCNKRAAFISFSQPLSIRSAQSASASDRDPAMGA